jgi:hypothetical protein
MLFSSQGCVPNVRPTKAETKAVVTLLLERGADIHAADKNGNNALTEAASKGCDRELIRMLIKAGAKINAGNASGLTPFETGLVDGARRAGGVDRGRLPAAAGEGEGLPRRLQGPAGGDHDGEEGDEEVAGRQGVATC